MTIKEFTKSIFEQLKASWFMPCTEHQVFSTEETVVGVWTDGKPLYRKCYDFGTFAASSITVLSQKLPSGINVVNAHATAVKKNSNTNSINPIVIYAGDSLPSVKGTNVTKSCGIYFYVQDDSSSGQYAGTCGFWTDGSDDKNYLTFQNAKMIVEYTKNSDTASTSKVPFEPLVEYSTQEKFVGYWIDGSQIYRKVLTGTVPTQGGKIAILTGVKRVLATKGHATSSTIDYSIPIDGGYAYFGTDSNLNTSSRQFIMFSLQRSTNTLSMIHNDSDTAWSGANFEISVEYIKA